MTGMSAARIEAVLAWATRRKLRQDYNNPARWQDNLEHLLSERSRAVTHHTALPMPRCPLHMSAECRLCCKSRKLQGSEFFAKTQSGRQSPIRITSFALPKSPMSLTRGDEVPHVLTRKSRLQPAEFLITSAKRLLQHNRH